MSTDRDTTRIVRSWLEEGVTALPDRVLDAVLDQLPATPQRRAWWPARRFPQMNNTAKLALMAAAVVVVALLGIRFLVPGGASIGAPTDAATPSPTASPAPLPPSGQLEPGSYFVDNPRYVPVRFTFAVPDGWTTDSDGFVSKHMDAPGEVAFASWVITHVFSNGCHTEGAVVEVGPTVDDLANALASQAERETSGPIDVTLGGYPARRVELTVPVDFDTTACSGEFIRNWAEVGGSESGGWRSRVGQVDEVYVLDVDGERVVISTWRLPGTSDTDLAELEGIIASIRFEP